MTAVQENVANSTGDDVSDDELDCRNKALNNSLPKHHASSPIREDIYIYLIRRFVV